MRRATSTVPAAATRRCRTATTSTTASAAAFITRTATTATTTVDGRPPDVEDRPRGGSEMPLRDLPLRGTRAPEALGRPANARRTMAAGTHNQAPLIHPLPIAFNEAIPVATI